MAGDAANPESDLREQLRVGVRMLEALDVQLGRAEETIKREEDARQRIDKAIERLEALESRARGLIEELESATAHASSTATESARNPGTEQLAHTLRRLADELVAEKAPMTSGSLTVTRPLEMRTGSTECGDR